MVDRGTKPSSSMISSLRRSQLPLQVEQAAVVPGLYQFVDQGGGGGKAHGHPPLTGSQAQTQGDVGLACDTVADGDDILPPVDVFTPGQFQDQGLVHRGDGQVVEGIQALTAGRRAARMRRSTSAGGGQ